MVATITPADLGPYANQPWNQVVWPSADGPVPIWDPRGAMGIPALGRGVELISGLIKQCPMDDVRGVEILPRPRILDAPDPEQSGPWYVGQHVADYLVNGNALSYVTAFDSEGWPAAAVWLPAAWVLIGWESGRVNYGRPDYWVGGHKLDPERVIHVRRGADPMWPARGVGVVEQYLSALNRQANADRYEASALTTSGVPSVAIIAPNPNLSPDEADEAKLDWLAKFGGARREPAILPFGTQVVPLAWSPADAQLTETRKLGLQDVANMLNLDGYYVGAAASALTYRSPGPMFLQLLRITLQPIMVEFEGMWSAKMLPRGRRVRFDRSVLLVDDLSTTAVTMTQLVGAGIWTRNEARLYMAMPVSDDPRADELTIAATPEPVADTPADEPVDEPNPSEGDTAA